MKTLFLCLTVLVVLAVNPVAMADPEIDLDDGGFHTFDDNTYQGISIRADFSVANDPGTHLNLVNNGIVGSLHVYNNAGITMSGGLAEGVIGAGDNSTVDVSGGTIGSHLIATDNSIINLTGGLVGSSLEAWHDSSIYMLGGSVGDNLSTWDNASITISGGTVGNIFSIKNNGVIYLDGTGFEVDGNPLVYGDKLSNFGTRIENGIYDYFTGTITGILSDGSALNNLFMIFNVESLAGTGDIIIIPEPATMLLLGLGGLMLRKKHN